MKYLLLILIAGLAWADSSPASAGTAPFGCDARAADTCFFRIFYARGGREVALPGGMKQGIPSVRIGQDSYCVGVGVKPRYKCARKIINDKYNN